VSRALTTLTPRGSGASGIERADFEGNNRALVPATGHRLSETENSDAGRERTGGRSLQIRLVEGVDGSLTLNDLFRPIEITLLAGNGRYASN
jgi:hypothetical protein